MDELIDKYDGNYGNLIVLGSPPGMGLPLAALHIACLISVSKEVLFISYKDFYKRIQFQVKKNSVKEEPNLHIDCDLPFYPDDFLEHLKRKVKITKAQFVFVDDLDTLFGHYDLNEFNRNNVLLDIKNCVQELGVNLFVSVELAEKKDLSSRFMDIQLCDFNWSRNLIKEADGIFSVFRPSFYGLAEPEFGVLEFEVRELKVVDRNFSSKLHVFG